MFSIEIFGQKLNKKMVQEYEVWSFWTNSPNLGLPSRTLNDGKTENQAFLQS